MRSSAPTRPSRPAQDLVLEAMLTRQQVILEERRTELAVVIGEAALHQVVGGTAVMRTQLTRLAEMSGTCPRITIQVLPFAAGAPPAGGNGPLSILRFAGAQTWASSTCPVPAAASAWTARRTLPATPEPSPC